MSEEDWGNYGEVYSKQSTLSSAPTFYSKIASSIFVEDVVTHRLDEPVTFLDVAAGPGILSLAFFETLQEKNVILKEGSLFQVTDFAPGMVEAAQNKLKTIDHLRVGISEVQHFQMDACNPDRIPTDSVTYLGCMFGVMFFPDLPKALRELHSKLKSNGKAIFSSWFDAEISDLLSDFNEFLSGVAIPNALKTLPCTDPNEFQTHLINAGFQNVTVKQIPHTFHMINNEGLYQGIFANPILIHKYPAILHADKNQLPERWKAFLSPTTSPYADRWISKEEGNALCMKWTANFATANA